MKLVVQKYGGTSVANRMKLERVADRIIDTYSKGIKVIAVVSAQGDTTDNLINLAQEYSVNEHQRELDFILSTGEIQTAAFLTMMLKDRGYNAVSLSRRTSRYCNKWRVW